MWWWELLSVAATTAVRLIFSLGLVLGVIAVGWVLTYTLLLSQLPVFREMLGRHQGKKRTTPQDARGRRQRAAKDAHDNDR